MTTTRFRGPFPNVSDERRRTMAAIRGKDTKPELAIRSLLHRSGYRFRLHRHELPGSPDIIFPSRRKAVFVHGCFWHRHAGCSLASVPKTRTEYWRQKFRANRARDRRAARMLASLGWKVMVIWECELSDKAALGRRLKLFLGHSGPLYSEQWPGRRRPTGDRSASARP